MAILEVSHIEKHFGKTNVLKDVSFSMEEGTALAIIGSSGSGKTTLLRCLNFLERPNSGTITVNGETLFDAASAGAEKDAELRKKRLHFGMVFQSFNLFPQYTALENVMLAKKLLAAEQPDFKERKREILTAIEVQAKVLLTQMGLDNRMDNYPHQLSGGMRQRVMIAMAVSCEPRLLIADEPTTALDVTIQAQILELMCELREKMGTAIMLITHDMGVVAETADDVLVLYAGKAVEYGSIEDIFERPKHPYTQGLLNSIPRLDEDVELLNTIEGTVPAPDAMPAGCRFAPRCPYGKDRCMKEKPGVYHAGNSLVSCFRYEGEK